MDPIQGETEIQANIPKQTTVINPAVKQRPIQFQQDIDKDPNIPSETTFQQDLTFAGQRKVNLIWEYTQAIIAVGVITANMIVGVVQGLGMVQSEFPIILSSSLFLVIGFYFSRTNHSAIGGVGQKPTASPYTGR